MNKTLEKRMSKLLLSDDKDLFPILMLFNGAIAARNRYDLFCFSTFFFTGDESKKMFFGLILQQIRRSIFRFVLTKTKNLAANSFMFWR